MCVRYMCGLLWEGFNYLSVPESTVHVLYLCGIFSVGFFMASFPGPHIALLHLQYGKWGEPGTESHMTDIRIVERSV